MSQFSMIVFLTGVACAVVAAIWGICIELSLWRLKAKWNREEEEGRNAQSKI